MKKITKRHLKKAIRGLGFDENDFNIDIHDFYCKKVTGYRTSIYNHFAKMVVEHIDKVQGCLFEGDECESGNFIWHYNFNASPGNGL